MERAFTPQGQGNDRILREGGDFFDNFTEIGKQHEISAFCGGHSGRGPLAAAAVGGIRAISAFEGTFSRNLYCIEGREGSQLPGTFLDSFGVIGRMDAGKGFAEQEVPPGVAGKRKPQLAEVYRCDVGFDVERIDVLLYRIEDKTAGKGTCTVPAKGCKDRNDTACEDVGGKTVGIAVGKGIFGGILPVLCKKVDRHCRVEEGTVGPGDEHMVKTFGFRCEPLKKRSHRPLRPADERNAGNVFLS